MTPEQRTRLNQLIRTWVHEPLVAGGFRRLKPRLWIYERPISAVVSLQTRQAPDKVVLFTLNWGFFSPRFAEAMHFPPQPNTVTSALRARIGRLIGDGKYDIWWGVHPDGGVTREVPFDVHRVDADHDTEMRHALTERVVPLAHSVTTTDDVTSRFTELTAILRTGLVDEEETLELIQAGTAEARRTWDAPESDLSLELPVVHVEPDEGSNGLLVTFDDEVAHHHEDLVLECLEYCRRFPNVRAADWQDREIITLAGKGIDAEQLQRDLLQKVQSVLAMRAAEDSSTDHGTT